MLQHYALFAMLLESQSKPSYNPSPEVARYSGYTNDTDAKNVGQAYQLSQQHSLHWEDPACLQI